MTNRQRVGPISRKLLRIGQELTVAFIGRALLPVAILTGKRVRPTTLIEWPILRCAFFALPLIAIGCSDDQIPLGTVQGDVTFNGLPVLAEVLFEPEADGRAEGVRPSTAYTDRNGHFELLYGSGRHGALVGKHRVAIKVFQTTEATGSTERTADPQKIVYLIREIVPGKNRLRFALSY